MSKSTIVIQRPREVGCGETPILKAAAKKRKGWLSAAILFFLEEHGPTTAHSVAGGLRRDFPRLLGSAVFIAMKKLHQRGLVHRVECSKTYMVTIERDPVHLLCSGCGGYVQTTDWELGEQLRGRAERRGFAASRLVLEVVGTCERCAIGGSEPAAEDLVA